MTDPKTLDGAEIALAHALCNGPDGEDWVQAQLRAPEAMAVIEEHGYVVMSRQMVDHLTREALGQEDVRSD